MRTIPETDTWQKTEPTRFIDSYGNPQLAGDFIVMGSRYWCSLIVLEHDPTVIEFMAFRAHRRTGKPSFFKEIFSWRGDRIPNKQDIDLSTFIMLMEKFFDYCTQKAEEANNHA